jgi:UDP-2,3-diacylglucosamine hydrolase
MTRIGILAGGGRLPLMIAESVAARGGSAHIVGIEGEADPAIARFPHTWVNWGQIGRMVAILRAEGGQEMVIAGAVTRPDLRRIRPDLGFFQSLPQILRLLGGGDDSVLTRVVRFFEANGLTVRGVHEVAPDLLAASGHLGASALSEGDCADADLGFAVRHALGPVDAGQAVVVAEGQVLAIEGAEGTDGMLQRVAGLRGRRGLSSRSGVLAKGPKPGQELRVDMPAIGPRTIEQVVAAGLAGVAVEAGAVLILDRGEAIAIADAQGCAVQGFAGRPWGSAGRADVARRPRTGRVIGRARPSRRDVGDLETGLAAVEGLAPFATGFGAVVVRRYVRAIEAAEGTKAMLERTAALRRQWGLRWRKVGVLVRRAEGAGDGERGVLGSLFAQAAAQELAGIAVTGAAAALAPYEELGRLADDLGLFLVLCEAI